VASPASETHSGSIAVLVLDREGMVVHASPSAAEVLGQSVDRTALTQLLGSEAAEEIRGTTIGASGPAPSFRGPYPVSIADPDGGLVFQAYVHEFGIGADGLSIITLHRRGTSDDARRTPTGQENGDLRSVASTTGNFVSTPEGALLACNEVFASMLGYASVEHALANRVTSLYADLSVREELIKRLREERSLKRFELDLVRSDGRSIHVIVNAYGQFDVDGRLEAIRGNIFDITEQRRLAEERTQLLVRERAARTVAEEALRHSAFLGQVGSALDSALDYRRTLAKLARLIVPALGDYCLIDERLPDGGSRRVAAAHIDPTKEGALLPDEVNHHDEDGEKHPVLHVIQHGTPVLVPEVTEEELSRIAHDEAHRAVLRSLQMRSYMIVPLTARGRTLGAITIVSSMSGRRYGRKDLEMAEEVAARAGLSIDNARLFSQAQEAARTREEVLAFVSHDLRNPLATILLNASALLATVPTDRLDADEREQLEWIARSSEQMNRMIQDLLDVARIDSGQLPIRPSATSVRSVVYEACALLHPQAREAGLALDQSGVPEALSAFVDRERILRVLLNLIGNSIRFSPGGGSITIGAGIDDGAVRVAVTDRGVGIASEDGVRLFEPYWQGRREGGGRNRGSGLGLAISKGIVEAHGGSIWFESRPEIETTFYFTLPIAPKSG
jgi:PAS domain S-box-containing protein